MFTYFGEVSKEIHYLKAEISTLKSKVAQLEKEKQPLVPNIFAHENAYTLHTVPYSSEPKVKIGEGQRDVTTGLREMRILTIEYQQHHVLLDICIQNEILSLTVLIFFVCKSTVLY